MNATRRWWSKYMGISAARHPRAPYGGPELYAGRKILEADPPVNHIRREVARDPRGCYRSTGVESLGVAGTR